MLPKTNLLTLQNVSMRFKKKYVLNDITAQIGQGITALLGPNGAGKSTIINLCASLYRPTSGEVLYNNESIHALGDNYRQHLSVLFQTQPMYKNDTAMEYLEFYGGLKNIGKDRIHAQGQQLLQTFGLADTEKKRINAFSGGMRQRLALCGAFLANPQILLLDEPSAGLDIQERELLKQHLCQIKHDRIILISTHIVSDIENIADQILILDQGKLIASGTQPSLVSNIEGNVWEIPTDTDIESSYYHDGKKYCCQHAYPGIGAKQETPNLTHAYLHTLKSR